VYAKAELKNFEDNTIGRLQVTKHGGRESQIDLLLLLLRETVI